MSTPTTAATPARFYITTPIYYANAAPHLGTFYSTVVADALARYHRARLGGENVYFLTGLDEHGQKIERMARERGQDPKTYCDGIAAAFKETWQRFGLANDRFIRTTDPDHEAAVLAMWRRMESAGDIYADDYEGLYCVGCEDWKSDDEIVDKDGVKTCPVHGKPVERVKERNYFFRLSKYADRLLAWYDAADPIKPTSRRNEVVEFVKRGLRDLSISRTAVTWGIPVPGDPAHTIYVWIDALTNYLTPLGGPDAVEKAEGRGALWAASHHLIAKDILRFHAVYWPAMLMSAGLPPPRRIFCHGYLTVKGQKISKSLPATRVDPNVIAAALGADALRYFVLREYSLGGDGDFTYESLFQRYESDLGNDLGNLLNRTVSMAHRYRRGAVRSVPAPAGAADKGLSAVAESARRQAEAFWEGQLEGMPNPSRALAATWELIRAANTFIDHAAPWKLAKEGQDDQLDWVLASCCEALRWAAMLVSPAMPDRAREALRQLGRETDEGRWPSGAFSWPGGEVAQPSPLFPRVDPDQQARWISAWVPAEALPANAAAPASEASAAAAATRAGGAAKAAKAAPGAEGAKAPEGAKAAPAAEGAKAANAAPGEAAAAEVTIDDFQKIELRAAKVLAATRVPKTEKLLQLTLDIGTEQRTVVSGIAGAYSPEAMIGKTVIYLANLKPAKIRGVLSQGMILAAGDAEVLAISALDRDVPPGTRVR